MMVTKSVEKISIEVSETGSDSLLICTENEPINYYFPWKVTGDKGSKPLSLIKLLIRYDKITGFLSLWP